MRTALLRAFVFSGAGLLVVVIFEALTFELPPKDGSAVWEQRLSLHIGLTVVVAVVALFGSLVGFALPAAGRSVSLKVAAALGVLFVALAAVVLVPISISAGLTLGSMLAFILAAALAWGCTRVVGKRAV
jgi:hypothetical protein